MANETDKFKALTCKALFHREPNVIDVPPGVADEPPEADADEGASCPSVGRQWTTIAPHRGHAHENIPILKQDSVYNNMNMRSFRDISSMCVDKRCT